MDAQELCVVYDGGMVCGYIEKRWKGTLHTFCEEFFFTVFVVYKHKILFSPI